MSNKEEKPEHRKFNCPNYNHCLNQHAKTNPNGRFDCTGCDPEKVTFDEPKPEPKGEKTMSVVKRCNKCGIEKAVDEFGKNASVADGYDRTCKDCWKQIRRNKKRSRINPGNPKKTPSKIRSTRLSKAVPSGADALASQLLSAVKKDAVAALLDFVRNDLPQIIEERFA